MARRILYRTQCFYCHKWIDAGKGWLQRVQGRWSANCDECYQARKENQNQPGRDLLGITK